MENPQHIDTPQGEIESAGSPPSELTNSLVPASWWRRLLYAVATIGIPIASFYYANLNGPLAPNWQSGKLSDYGNILLGRTGAGIFYLFLAYSMLCMLLLLVSPRRFSRFFLVRLGIYTGVILALQYVILLRIAAEQSLFYAATAAGVLLPAGVSRVYPRITARFGMKRTLTVIISLAFGLLLISIFAYATSSWSIVLILLWIAVLGSGPVWCLVVASLVALRLLRDYELRQKHAIWHILGISAWVLAYVEAWPVALSRTLQLYASLPTSQPNCYIATAAASGHPRIVRSRPFITGSGQRVWLNDQVRYLKGAELALMTLSPGGHQVCRAIYDRLGPRLAHLIAFHPLLADMAYLSLKPFEWGFKGMVALLRLDVAGTVERLYTDIK